MINSRAGIRAMKRGLLAVFLVFSITSVSQAGPLGVGIDPIPSLLAGYITSTYTASTGVFSALGWALSLDANGGGQVAMTPTPFKIVATIDNSGVLTSGSLSIGNATSPLLSGLSLVPNGFAFQGNTLEFLFGSIGGSYAASGLYSSAPDRPVDVMLTVGPTFQGFSTTWSSSSNTAQVNEDPAGAPEPSALLLMVAGAGAFYRQIRKRKALT